ncbi:MAG: ribose-phosphate diphosphokinase [Bacteroidales bacterium]|nr:ribose-phosphate diphosphokinase [Bacteroidales bacterium]
MNKRNLSINANNSYEEIKIFSGSGSMQLTKNICKYLGVDQGQNEVIIFSEGNIFVKIKENVRGKRVYIVQSTSYPANDNFMELLFWIDAFKRASADSVTVIMPYFSYAKGDKKDEPRVSIRARVCADAIEVAGADRVVTLDLHAAQIQGFFKCPVDDLYAFPVLCKRLKEKRFKKPVIVSPDAGFAKKARLFANALHCPVAIAEKVRTAHDEKSKIHGIIGEVEGMTAIIVDDFTTSGNTLSEVSNNLMKMKAKEVYVAVTHGLFNINSMKIIEKSPIKSILITDSVELQTVKLNKQIEVVSVAPLLGEAIKRIHYRESISDLFDNP